MVQKNLAVLMWWPYYPGRLKFHELRSEMTNTRYSTFAVLEQLFSIINNWNVDIVYSNLNFSLKTVQEQAQSTRSIKLTCQGHCNFLTFEQVAVLTG